MAPLDLKTQVSRSFKSGSDRRLELLVRSVGGGGVDGFDASVAPFGEAIITVRVVEFGDVAPNQLVTLSLDGAGTLDTTVVNTGQGGEAEVRFVGGAEPGSTRINGAITLVDPLSDSVVVSVSPTVTVRATPDLAIVDASTSADFEAVVTGAPDGAPTGVTWSANGGSIDATGHFVAGDEPGRFLVVARAIADPLAFDRVEVEVLDQPGSVTRTSSGGHVNVSIFRSLSSCGDEYFRNSPGGATAWTDTLSCAGTNGESGVASVSFTETYAGSDLVAVTASSSSTAVTDEAAASGSYSLEFTVARATEVAIDAQLTGGATSGLEFRFFPAGLADNFIIDDRDGGSFNETALLVPARYVVLISAVSGGTPPSGTVSFSLDLTFGP